MASSQLFVLALVGASWFACGTVWTMQLINYPLLREIGPESFQRFEQAHNRRFGLVVIPALAVVLVSLIAIWVGPIRSGHQGLLVAISVLLLAIVAVTAARAAPAHAALARGFDEAVYARLMSASWLRTIAWTALAVSSTALLVPA